MKTPLRHLLLACGLLLGCAAGVPAQAAVAIKVASIAGAGVELQGVTARFDDEDGGRVRMTLRAQQANLPALGWRRVRLALDGTLTRDAQRHWVYSGSVKLGAAPGGAFDDGALRVVVDGPANTLRVALQQGQATVGAWLPLDQPTHAQVVVKNLPVAWLQGLLDRVASGQLEAGLVSADLALDVLDRGVRSSGQFTLTQAGFDTPGGTLAAQGLSASGRFDLDATRRPERMDLDASLRGGQVLMGSLFAELPDHPVQLSLRALSRSNMLDISRLRFNDADALQVEGALGILSNGTLGTLKLSSFHASFPAAYERYGRAWLGTMGVHDATVAGDLAGSLDLGAGGLQAFAFRTQALDFVDGGGRFAVRGLHGGLDWAARSGRPATTLGWSALQARQIPLGPAETHWRDERGTLTLVQAAQVPILGGSLHVGSLLWNPGAARGQRLELSLAVAGIDMGALGHALGWPAFPGTLAGAIPSLRWVDDRIDLGGGLSANLFGGFIDITGVSVRDPLGATPLLAADVAISQLDLGAITSVFDFGSITGRLDGSIDGLRLVDWSPVAFQARLLAAGGGRISQRAVNNLTEVGGGGVAAGVQGAVLKLFKTFGYKEIGLNCTLQGTVCEMSGLAPAGDGYTIVEGSGLPYLRVVGHQKHVDWPTLVRRLHAAIGGAAPQVR